jgi:UDPglucose--hexose-1-phosphate uridylyltransferase
MSIEIRKDYLTDRYTFFSPKRASRPHDTKKGGEKKSKVCPFCPGNEYMTPPAVFELKKNGGWEARIIPNKFPITNIHEVIIESAKHDSDIADEPVKKVSEIIELYIQRYIVVSRNKYIKYVQIFRNRGMAGGASLRHPHTQVAGLPMIPRLVKEEMDACRKYKAKKKSCIFCDLARKESVGKRFVSKNNSFAAFTAYASRFPYETWIVPKMHVCRISDLSKKQVNAFAGILKSTLMKLDNALKKPPYNYIIHQSPLHGYGYYHMHLEIMPATTMMAGLEKSTDCFVNLTMPEEAAKLLRKA